MSKLNPHATEFIPRHNTSLLNSCDTLTALGILNGFERKCTEICALLKTAANMLLDATHFPATFDSHLEIISELVWRNEDDDVLEDLAEMLLTWGINNSGLRYTAVRMCDCLCKLPIQNVFRNKLLCKLKKRYSSEKHADHSEPASLMELSLFMAEMFYRVRVGEKQDPLWILGLAIFDVIFILLELKQDQTMICVCNILKLCGVMLDQFPKQINFNQEEKMETVLAMMRSLSVEKNTSERTSDVIISVLRKRAMKWSDVDQLQSSKRASTQVSEEMPVTYAFDWDDYLDQKGNMIEGTNNEPGNYPGIDFDNQLDPELDEEMLREYEKLVQETIC